MNAEFSGNIEDYFDKIFCINLDRRIDRWKNVKAECKKHGLNKVERFRAHEVISQGVVHGHAGCNASHQAIAYMTAHFGWDKVLVLEDDFHIRHEDFHSKFAEIAPNIPEDWDVLYLGGQYGNDKISRVNHNIIRCDLMLTTSSYGIRAKSARQMAPYLGGVAIDNTISSFAEGNLHYITQPRLFIQAEGFSDLSGMIFRNQGAMEDLRHEMLV